MESPIGLNSDFWLPFQEKLAEITKVIKYILKSLNIGFFKSNFFMFIRYVFMTEPV